MTNNFCVKWTENNCGVQALHSICMHISNTNVCYLELYKWNNLFFFPKKPDCCPTEGKQKRKYKIFKSKNLTNSVAGEFLLIYAQQAKSNKTAVRNGEKKTEQETGLGNRGRLKVLNDTKLVLNEHEWPLNHLGSIWYMSFKTIKRDPIGYHSDLGQHCLTLNESRMTPWVYMSFFIIQL